MAGEERSVKVKIDHVEKIYEGRNGKMIALNGVDLDIMENEFICVVGPSGCGKSTLLNIIAGLLEPTSGAVYINGKEVLNRNSYKIEKLQEVPETISIPLSLQILNRQMILL